jgi:hypothetical protein
VFKTYWATLPMNFSRDAPIFGEWDARNPTELISNPFFFSGKTKVAEQQESRDTVQHQSLSKKATRTKGRRR